MALKVVYFMISLLVYFKHFTVFGLVAKETIYNISKEEDLELDKQLKVLNKPAAKTFHSDYGDIFDCVSIYNQPSLNHPLLTSHKVQCRPSSTVENMLKKTSFRTEQISKVHFIECPEGTVPIRMTTKEDLIRAKSFYMKYNTDLESYMFAGIQTKGDSSTIYRGARAFMSLNEPYVKDGQWSGAILSVQSGKDSELNYIRIGWMRNPELYGDTSTRMFTAWAANPSRPGCVNIRCSGFVQTDRTVPLDSVFNTHYYFAWTMFAVSHDPITGNWWLQFGPNFLAVGYWPKELFTSLSNGADYIGMGGQVHESNDLYWPEMGKGAYSDEDFIATASMSQIVFANNSFIANIPDNAFVEVHEDRCYLAGDNYYRSNNQTLQYSFIYGGSGGAKDKCV